MSSAYRERERDGERESEREREREREKKSKSQAHSDMVVCVLMERQDRQSKTIQENEETS